MTETMELPFALTEQAKQLKRVRDSIDNTVLVFMEAVPVGGEFNGNELHAFVAERHPNVSPSSPSRVLRALRRERLIDYQVTNRRAGAYQRPA